VELQIKKTETLFFVRARPANVYDTTIGMLEQPKVPGIFSTIQ
jgi:hypothetical protein